MKTLYLLRHGKSSWDDPALDDHDRPLAPRGIRAAGLVGRHMKERGARLDLVLTSTARRAMDTTDRVLAELGSDAPVERERGLYLCGARVLLERLLDAPDTATAVMLVAHNPDLHELATLLAAEGDPHDLKAVAEKFPTAACAVLLFGAPHWKDLEPGAGRLVEFVLPRKLA